MNDSFVMKIVWELCMRPSNVWAKVVRGKYRCGDELKSNINKGRRGSSLYKGIKTVWDNFEEHCKWITVKNMPNF